MHAPYLDAAAIPPLKTGPLEADSFQLHPPQTRLDATPSRSTASTRPAGETVATNVRRLMARDGLTFSDVVEMTGLDERTVRGLVRGSHNPHARTLHKFAAGLGVSIDELFEPAAARSRQAFDRATNPVVREVVEHLAAANSPLFDAWGEADFHELYSQFGTGGALTEQGVLTAAEAINAKRALLRQVAVILETAEADLLTDFVKLLYRRVTVSSSAPPEAAANAPPSGANGVIQASA
jgi:transcriptional regulator with XRE-family HTH domain